MSQISEGSDLSDTEMSDKQDDKDTDFNVDDYHEIDSDDSFSESLENNVNVCRNVLYHCLLVTLYYKFFYNFYEFVIYEMLSFMCRLYIESICLVIDK